MRSRVDFGATASGLCGREPMQDEQQPDLIGLSAEIVSGTASGRANTGLLQESVIGPTFSAVSALSTRGDS
jgi:hypothetical protein